MDTTIKQYRKSIAKQVKALRKQRHLTQKDLAEYLDLSQNRISQIEAGHGSFSAEHLLLLAKKFNVPASSFVSEKTRPDPSIQNALARHGAQYLREDDNTLPSEKLDDVVKLVREVLIVPDSPRAVAGLAAVIVQHADLPILNRLRLQFINDGAIQRYGWLLENTVEAIKAELAENLSDDWKRKYKRADFVLKTVLESPGFALDEKSSREDILDTIVTQRTLDEARAESSDISKKWKIITRLGQPDFVRALKESREVYREILP